MNKKFNMAIRQMDHAAETVNIYKTLLGITDDSDIRELERNSTDAETTSLRLYLIGDIRQMGDAVTGPVLTTPGITKSAPKQFKDLLMSNTILLIENILNDNKAEVGHIGDLVDTLDSIEEILPDKYYSGEIREQIRSIVYQPFADAFCNTLFSLIDWRNVFTTDSPAVWCRNLLELIRSIAGDEVEEKLEPRREPLIHTMVQYWKDTYPGYRRMSDCKLRELRLEPYDGEIKQKPSTVPIPLVLANPEEAVKKMLEEDRNSPKHASNFKLREIPADELAPFWMTPFTVTSEFLCHNHLYDAQAFLLKSADPPLLFYTTLDLYSRAGEANVLPVLPEIMMLSYVMPKAIDDATRDLICPKKLDELATFDTTALLPIKGKLKTEQKEIQKGLNKKDPAMYPGNQILAPATNLYEIIASVVSKQPNYNLRIPTKHRDLLKDFGFNEGDASLLGGYIAGLMEMDTQNILLARLLEAELSEEEEDEEPEINHEELTARISDALKEHYDTIENRADERIGRIQAKAQKESGKLQHALNQAQQEITDLTEERDTLSGIVRDLERECERLRGLIPTDPDEDPEIFGDDVPSYPSEIGKDQKIIVVGGSENWVKELSKRFPHIRFFGTAITPDDRAIFAADYIFVNIFYLKHKHYWPVAGAAKRAGKPLCQFPSAGINACSDYIVQTCRTDATTEGKED